MRVRINIRKMYACVWRRIVKNGMYALGIVYTERSFYQDCSRCQEGVQRVSSAPSARSSKSQEIQETEARYPERGGNDIQVSP
jgi:hypothetical protein